MQRESLEDLAVDNLIATLAPDARQAPPTAVFSMAGAGVGAVANAAAASNTELLMVSPYLIPFSLRRSW